MEKGLSRGCRFFYLPTLVCDILSGFNRVLLEYLNVNFHAKKKKAFNRGRTEDKFCRLILKVVMLVKKIRKGGMTGD